MSKKFRIFHGIVTCLPTIWFPVLTLVGNYLYLTEITNNRVCPTLFGMISSIVIILLFFFAQIYYLAKNPKPVFLEENSSIFAKVADSLYRICEDKYDNIIDYITEKKERINIESFSEIHDPNDSIDKILEGISNLFSNLISIRSNDILSEKSVKKEGC